MANKIGPYVGITGFMSRAEVVKALSAVPGNTVRRLMVGVLMSFKTLSGYQNEWPGRYPKKEAVADIFVKHKRNLNLVHYSTVYKEELSDQLEEIVKIAGPHLDGFQLNIAWPPLEQVRKYKRTNPDKLIVLQVGSKAMEQAASTNGFKRFVRKYKPLVDAILIDPSGGRGMPFDAVKAAEYLRIVRDCCPILGLGIAGGLGPDTLHLLDSLVPEFPKLSIDAEHCLRTREDALCLNAMQIYLEDAFPILDGVELPGLQLRNSCESYGFDKHIERYGSGDNMLRTMQLSQPSALRVDDTLATGDKVLSVPRDAGNGGVWIHLSGGFDGHWIRVPARIPIALLSRGDNVPEAVWKLSEEK